jgi:hypothetical protein
MNAIVHMGLADAGEADIQHWFRGAEGVNYLGVKSGDETLDRANRLLLVQDRYDPKPLDEVYAAALARPGLPVLSNPMLSSWRRFDPEDAGERLKRFMPRPRVIFVTRRPAAWAQGRYFDQLSLFQRDTYAGINPWLEKHMSRLRVGSHIAPARFVATLERFLLGAGAEEFLVLPYEMLVADRAGFIARLEAFTGLEGALQAVEARHEPVERSMDVPLANAYRMLGLRRREPEEFKAAMALINRQARKKVQARFEELTAAEADDADWVEWFRTAKGTLVKAIAEQTDAELTAALWRFDDYALREGLAEYLAEIEAAETANMLEKFGVDLRPWGYAAEPPQPARR